LCGTRFEVVDCGWDAEGTGSGRGEGHACLANVGGADCGGGVHDDGCGIRQL
jgi:hypothetical protein